MVSNVNDINRRSWDGKVVLRKRLEIYKASAFISRTGGEKNNDRVHMA